MRSAVQAVRWRAVSSTEVYRELAKRSIASDGEKGTGCRDLARFLVFLGRRWNLQLERLNLQANLAIRQRFSQLFQRRIRHLGTAKIQRLQFLQQRQVLQPRIRHQGAIKVQRL